jgi:hypothetical protein
VQNGKEIDQGLRVDGAEIDGTASGSRPASLSGDDFIDRPMQRR